VERPALNPVEGAADRIARPVAGELGRLNECGA
jgi:hypothetical protein